jgi:hypothetical protein
MLILLPFPYLNNTRISDEPGNCGGHAILPFRLPETERPNLAALFITKRPGVVNILSKSGEVVKNKFSFRLRHGIQSKGSIWKWRGGQPNIGILECKRGAFLVK